MSSGSDLASRGFAVGRHPSLADQIERRQQLLDAAVVVEDQRLVELPALGISRALARA
jgi:hypothetical protein